MANINLTKSSSLDFKKCQFISELISLTGLTSTSVTLQVSDSFTQDTLDELTSVWQTALNNHVAQFENTVKVKLCEIYGELSVYEVAVIGSNEALRGLLQSVNVTLNELEISTNFVNLFFTLCQMNNFTSSGAQNITGVDTTNKKFEVAGNFIATYSLPVQFLVEFSTGNNGWYTKSSVSYDSGNDKTIITVVEAIPDNTVDGTIRDPIMSDTTKQNLISVFRDHGLDI